MDKHIWNSKYKKIGIQNIQIQIEAEYVPKVQPKQKKKNLKRFKLLLGLGLSRQKIDQATVELHAWIVCCMHACKDKNVAKWRCHVIEYFQSKKSNNKAGQQVENQLTNLDI